MADEKERNKKERMTKWKFLLRNFSTARNIRQTSRVASQYTCETELLWLDLALRFARALPIPYVQATVLNLQSLYNYGVATALRDKSIIHKTHVILHACVALLFFFHP